MNTKPFIHFNSYTEFSQKRLSANYDNTQYTIGLETRVHDGEPDISYNSIVFVKDKSWIWTHGVLYGDVRDINSILVQHSQLLSNLTDSVSTALSWNRYPSQDFLDSDIIKYVNLENGEEVTLLEYDELDDKTGYEPIYSKLCQLSKYKTMADFQEDLGNDKISKGVICFIEDSGEIYLDGAFYGRSGLDLKYGCMYYDTENTTLYAFKSIQDKDEWLENGSQIDSDLILDKTFFEFSSVTYQINLTNNNGSNILYFSNDVYEAKLSLTPSTLQKKLTESEWSPTNEDYKISVQYDKNTLGEWTDIVVNENLIAGETYTLDVLKLLSSTASRFRITVEGVASKQITYYIYSVTLTSMYLRASNFNWYTPYIQGTQYRVGGLLIGGSLNKTLYIKITNGESYNLTYNVNIGSQTFTNTPYFFEGLRFPETGTGVYNLEIWLDAGSVQSEHLFYNILCVAEEDISTAQLVAVSNSSGTAINYYDNHLFDFAIYNRGVSIGNVEVEMYNVVHAIPSLISQETLHDVPTSISNGYVKNIEIDSEEADISLLVNVIFGNEQKLTLTLDNAYNFPPTSGAKFYLNPSSRSNTQENRGVIINTAVSSGDTELETIFNRITWADGADGWTEDNEGRKCLRLPATTSCDFAYPLFDNVTNGRTIEMTFKVENASDYTKPIIYCCDNPNSDQFLGIKIFPTKIVVHSSQLNTTNYDAVQSYSFKDEEVVNLIITISYGYKSQADWNICAIYVNGVKKCEFAFSGNDNWLGSKFTHFGSDYADLFLYNMRVYGQSFGFSNTLTNYVNSLNSLDERIIMRERNTSVCNDDWDIDIDKVKDVANYAVVEITNPNDILPGYGLSKEYTTWCNWEQHYVNHPDWDFKITDGKLSGQGTTSMNYYWWNLRVRTDESTDAHPTAVTYPGNPTMALDGEIDAPVKLCGDKYPGVYRITAKKNYASSMQSHKMGGTAAFNDLHDAVVGPNEVNGRTALYQYPFYVFQKIRIESADAWIYKFIGLYTIGPDKGDKPTYGYDNAAVKNDLLVLEGIDHNKQLAIFKYPWDSEKVTYDADSKSLAIIKDNNTIESGWEVSISGSAKTASTILSKMISLWKPAYEVAYKNNPFLLPFDESKDNINTFNASDWRIRKTPEGHSYERYEIWASSSYDLYYYDIRESKYKPSGINVLYDLGLNESSIAGMTLEEKNEFFIQKRCERFYANWKTYFHEDDTIFHYTWCFIFGATDNYAKNSYPYILGTYKNGYKWRWRQDDLDTIFDIDNQGHSVKTYSIEPDDWSSDLKTAYAYKGEDSAFWTLIRMTCTREINRMGKNILAAMYSLGSGTSTYDRIASFFHKYFWDNAQDYFTKSAYNVDAELIYENAWPDYNSGKYKVDVSPLQQLLGDHYEAERAWVEKRIIYCMSRFNYGPFVEYSDSCLGLISFRTQNQLNLEVTPALDLYPVIISGAGTIVGSSDRIEAGNPVSLNGVGGTNTNVYIMAADWLQSLGDLRNLQVDSESATPLTLGVKRLEEVKLGDEDASTVTCNIQSLVVGNSPSLTRVDCRNVSSLTGALDFSKAPRLKELYLGGTDVRALIIANGARIVTIELPPNIALIDFNNLKYLETANESEGTGLLYEDLSHIRTLRLENCYSLDEFQMLKDCYNAGDELTSIRVVGFDYEGDLSDIDILANIKNGIDCNGNSKKYDGIDANGNIVNTSIPIIEGTINLNGGAMYRDSYEDISNYFYNLNISIEGGFYTRIHDPYIRAILLNAGLGHENDDIHESRLAGIADTTGTPNLKNMFLSTLDTPLINAAREHAESFDELFWFKNIKTTQTSIFANYVALKSVALPENMTTMSTNMFTNCSSLENIKFNRFLTSIGSYSLSNCTSLRVVDLPVSLTSCTANAFAGCTNISKVIWRGTDENWAKITFGSANANPMNTSVVIYSDEETEKTSFVIPDGRVQINAYSFLNWEHVVFDNLLQNNVIQQIGTQAFKNCKSIKGDMRLRYLNKLDTNAFEYCTGLNSFESPEIINIPNYAFRGCTGLTTVTLPVSQLLGSYAFSECSSLGTVSIPNCLDISATYIFYKCSSLKEINFPKASSSIGSNFAQYCDELETVNLPASSNSLGANSFSYCPKLKNVTLGPGCSFGGGNIFQYDTALEHFEVTPRHMQNSGHFNGCLNLREIVIHDGCGSITPNAITANDGAVSNQGLGMTTTTTVHQGCTLVLDCPNINVEMVYNTSTSTSGRLSNMIYRVVVPDEKYDWYANDYMWGKHLFKLFPQSEYDKQPTLDYIEFSGAQYYDTGIHGNRYLKLDIYMETPYEMNSQTWVCGTRDTWYKQSPEYCGPKSWGLKFDSTTVRWFTGVETNNSNQLKWTAANGITPTTTTVSISKGLPLRVRGGYDDGFEIGYNTGHGTAWPNGMRRAVSNVANLETTRTKDFADTDYTIWLGGCSSYGLPTDTNLFRTAKIFFAKFYYTWYTFEGASEEYHTKEDAIAAAVAMGKSASIEITSRDEYIADFRPSPDGRFKNIITGEYIENVGTGDSMYGEY